MARMTEGSTARGAKGNAPVHELIKWYEQRTRDLGNDPLAKIAWAYSTFTNGEKISRCQRVVYRERVDLQATFPDPFDSSGYESWWNTQGKTEYPDLFDEAT